MLESTLLSAKFSAALDYSAYVATGNEQQRQRWRQVYDEVAVTGGQKERIGQFTRRMNLLVVSGIWCGDCVQQCPLIQRIAETNPGVLGLKFLDRDLHKDLSDNLKINGGGRVPVMLLMSEDFQLCSVFGDRTLGRYRALAARKIGPACPLAIAPPAPEEMAETLQDWLNEIERVQLMLRLSPRLRERYGD